MFGIRCYFFVKMQFAFGIGARKTRVLRLLISLLICTLVACSTGVIDRRHRCSMVVRLILIHPGGNDGREIPLYWRSMWSRAEQECIRSGTSAEFSWQPIKMKTPTGSPAAVYEVSASAQSSEAALSALRTALIVLRKPETSDGLVHDPPGCLESHCERYLSVEILDPPIAVR